MIRLILGIVVAASMWTSAAQADAPKDERKYLLERVDDAAVVQVYADGFKDLPLEQKLLVWHLYQAGIAGRDIYYDQRYARSLSMRSMLEAIISHSEGVEAATLSEVRRYAKLFWLNSGPFNHLTARKFVLKCTPEAFAAAFKTAIKNGATNGGIHKYSPDSLLDMCGRDFFDPEYHPVVTNKTPGPGKDVLTSSANNLYVGVTMKDLDGFTERYGLNSRLVKRQDRPLEEIYRVGGLYSDSISRVIGHLQEAKKHAPPRTVRTLEALIRFYKTGEEADRKAYDIAWVQDKDAPVDTINGFIEVYMDPRGVKGSWEAAVFFRNAQKTAAIKKLAEEAQWFEDHMPWDMAYRKPNVRGITANAIDIVIETGDSGPISPIGINLPNDETIRERYGSKSVSLSNIIDASDRSTPTAFRAEFSWTKEEAERAQKWSALSNELLVNMHEVIGHASGRVSDRLQGKPQDELKEFFSALEEGRADLVGLYYMSDPKLAALGLVKAEEQDEMARAAYEAYARNGLVQLRRVRDGSQIEEDHMRNRQMIVNWLIVNTKAVEVRRRDGKTYNVMTDAKAFREGVGRLLAEVQRIKSEGDYQAAKALFDTHGIHFDPALRDEVVGRVRELDLPSYTGYVYPRLTPAPAADGTLADVIISYPQDLTTQMLEFAAVGQGR
jgi:dipeptidyl-peptidase-3